MAKEEIEIIINRDGTVSGDVMKGPGGAGCLSMLDGVLSGLGRKTEMNKKPEFYDNKVTNQSSVKRGR